MKLKVIDLFAGAGGLSYGFYRNPDFSLLAANEILKDASISYELNHPNVKVYRTDVRDLLSDVVMRDFGLKQGDLDVLIGGPPCQAYSTVGKRLMTDNRAVLFQEYYRLLRDLKPKFFIFENVKGLLSMQGGKLVDEIINLFESLGYKTQRQVLNSADYGVPQIRKRVIITGTLFKKKFKYPEPSHTSPEKSELEGKMAWITLSEAIGDLPFIKSNQESTEYSCLPKNEYQIKMRKNSKGLTDHVSPKNSDWLVQIMQLLPDGGSPDDLPEDLRPKSGFGNTYCKLWWEKPCTTITRNLGTPSSSRCIHPKAPRPLTTREGARIQSFPDNFIFYGSKSAKNLQIGEAVPVILADALARAVAKHFKENKRQWMSLTSEKEEKYRFQLNQKTFEQKTNETIKISDIL